MVGRRTSWPPEWRRLDGGYIATTLHVLYAPATIDPWSTIPMSWRRRARWTPWKHSVGRCVATDAEVRPRAAVASELGGPLRPG